MNIEDLKEKIPYRLKECIKYIYFKTIPLHIRYGRLYRKTYAFLQKSQWWSREKLEEYQIQQLERLLNHVYENVPYYRMVFDERGLKPKDFQSFDDLKKLPYLTKELVRNNLADLIDKNCSESKLIYVTTGGSTGIPLGFYWEKGITDPKEWGFVLRQWHWGGFNPGERRMILRGALIDKFKNGKRMLWENYRKENALIFSSFDMTEENLPEYIEKIKQFKPVAIQGYPSTLYILSNFLKNNNLIIENIKCIFTSSENLYPYQREVIENYLGAKIFDHYGNTERNVSIMECEKGGYHIMSEYGIVELLDEWGNSTNKEGEMGEIIATGFNNYAMPFIRYKTDDIAIYSDNRCPCGREYPLIKAIEGRLQEFIATRTGRLISMTAINMHSDVFDNVKQFQFYQEKKGEVTFNIVRGQTYNNRDTEYIRSELCKKLGDDMKLEIRFVEHIPRTKSGKYRFLIQKLPLKYGD